jgi:hypothetical protein
MAGISIIIIGVTRKIELKKTPSHDFMKLGFLNFSSVIGLNQANGSHYLGMGLSLNF